MSLTQLAVAGRWAVRVLQTQGGRALAEVLLALTLFAAITTALAHYHIGGLLLRLTKWLSLLLLGLVVAFLFL
ncbi:hypothetical protein NDI56_08550 [Haloarcula sp. S1CR25-12]|uniref:Uncharacterized protein n=1 Tax=Haloarcula saliterrae TaxID=2950534 RepID=A0ABU2FAZ3_9EURY|nr:hypothetical protein [Haloarcula sp. S1CR25-12]MDS0259440.1 hypothetical protein [Haloarcula sp. S1CR25-12]